jgi:3-hydroxyisobutyrate dehydrogenase-like beta-hydroxyacid dehydrogenase
VSGASTVTVGILYAGELGSTLGRLLRQGGLTVVTTLEDRSLRTADLCRPAGLCILPSLSDVLSRADILLSLVSPSAAVALAECYRANRPAAAPAQVYVDINSIAPDTAQKIAKVLDVPGVTFVDGAVHGLASALPERGTLYLSGQAAPVVAELFGRCLRVRVLGSEPGRASAFKMLISGLNKGVVALFVELALAARQAGMLDELLLCYRDVYPGIMGLVDRLLPTYPQHAGRRGDELQEVERALQGLGVEPRLAGAARRLTQELADARLQQQCEAGHAWSVLEVLEAFAAARPEPGKHR